MSNIDRATLRRAMAQQLSIEEIRNALFDLNLDDSGQSKDELIRNIILHFEQRDQLNILVTWLQDNRPDIVLRLLTDQEGESTTAIDQESETLELTRIDENEPGWLDSLIEIEETSVRVIDSLNTITVLMEDMSSQITVRGNEMQTARGNNARMHKVVQSLALDLSSYSQRIGSELDAFETTWNHLIQHTLNLASNMNINNANDLASATGLKISMTGLQQVISEAVKALRPTREAILQTPKISRELNQAIGKTAQSVDRIIKAFSAAGNDISRVVLLVSRLIDSGKNLLEGDPAPESEAKSPVPSDQPS